MIKKCRILLLSVLITAATVCICLFAGCKINKTLQDILDENNLKYRVTYILNEGEFEDGKRIKDMYYPENVCAFNIGNDKLLSGNAAVSTLLGNIFDTWYVVEPNENGNLDYVEGGEYVDGEKLDENKTIKASDTKFDFSQKLTQKHVYLCGKWIRQPHLNVNLVCDGDDFDKIEVPGTGEETFTYNNGDTLISYALKDKSGPLKIEYPGTPLGSVSGYTFVGYYTDEACTDEFSGWPYTISDDVTEDPQPIYARYLKGTWTVVKTANDVKSMFKGGASGSTSFYVLNDIDCQGIEGYLYTDFYAKIVGHKDPVTKATPTISNLKLRQQSVALSMGSKSSVFGEIDSDAVIKDVAFKDLDVTFDVFPNANVEIFAIFTSINPDANISNVEIGGTFTVNLNGGRVNNANSDGHWLFGGYESDSEYTAENGFKVASGTSFNMVGGDNTTTYTYNG